MIDLEELQEKVILIAVSTGEEDGSNASLDELEELAATAGAVTVGRVIQNRERIHPGTYLGKGKIDEVRDLVWELHATGVICDDELSPAQLRNLEDSLDTKVMDRTMVILDIFASRASTREGKIQVELAQLKYRAVRLVGMRNSLSRLGGGIGTRGPGEKKLETDRRLIHQRIGQLKEELADVKRHREVTRQQREKNFALSAAIVGYTNAGKSTLLNALLRQVTLEEGVAYFPQEVPDDEVRALLVELRALPTAERGRVLSIVARLESPPARVLDGEELSPGEVRKLMIARSLLSSPRLIVMDEPTNHLDIRSIEALQDVLRHCACALVLVSHDEQFLDALVDERWVFEVEQEKGEVGLGDTHVRVVR